MVSEQAKAVMDDLRKGKERSKGEALTPESVLRDRAGIDKIFEKVPLNQNIGIEAVETADFKGEFFTLKGSAKVLLFLHGGAFMNGSVFSRRKLCHDIMEASGMDALSVDYGQWPESKHPQALNDAVAAYKWLMGKGYDPQDILFFGESAGAMLTLTSILYLKDQGIPLPGKAVVFSPVAGQDMDLDSHSSRDDRDPMISYEPVVPYYEGSDFESPYVSPGNGDFSGFPQLCIHVGTEEALYDDSRLIYQMCQEDGVDVTFREWEGLFHVFPLFDIPETKVAVKEIAAFLKGDH